MNKARQQRLTHKARLAKARNQHAKDFYYGHWQTEKRKRASQAQRRTNRLGDNLALLAIAMQSDKKYQVNLNDIAVFDSMSHGLLRAR